MYVWLVGVVSTKSDLLNTISDEKLYSLLQDQINKMQPEENAKQLSSAAATATDTLVCERVGILALKQLELLHSGNTVQPAEILVQEADAAKEEGASSLLAVAEPIYGPRPSKSTNPQAGSCPWLRAAN